MMPPCHTQTQITPLLGHQTDREIATGLAPEIPEDLYMLIKKVNMTPLCLRSLIGKLMGCNKRPLPSESTSSATEKTRTASSV
jgi:hypothetical protein